MARRRTQAIRVKNVDGLTTRQRREKRAALVEDGIEVICALILIVCGFAALFFFLSLDPTLPASSL